MAEQLFLIFFSAVIVERLTDSLKGIFPFFNKDWQIRLFTLIIGLLFAYFCDLNLLGAFGFPVKSEAFGLLITGTFVGSGSNTVHDLISDFNNRNNDYIDADFELSEHEG